MKIDPTFVPETPEDLARCLADPWWRLCSGQLYRITIKAAEGETVVPFIPNRAQRRLMERLWHRNVLLKARQLGMTTLVSILWLDHATWNDNQLCVQVAQTREDAEAIFKGKVLLAYDNLPEPIKLLRKEKTRSKTELELSNGSIIRVATSARGGTPHRLHISEMGKIAAKFPDKAEEIVTGGFPAVPIDGVLIVESTAEGQDGHFKSMVDTAMELAESGVKLNPKQMRFHFFPWWEEPAYCLDDDHAGRVAISPKEHEYFDKLEPKIDRKLSLGQRAWWVTTLLTDCSGDIELMWREYPSLPEEAFQVSIEGTYYAEQLRIARESSRIGRFPYLDGYPVNTFWDIGSSDGTAIWLHQAVGHEQRFFAFVEDWDRPYSHFISELQRIGLQHGVIWGTHHLPHDADHKRQQGRAVTSPKDELMNLKGIGGTWITVPRVDELIHGVQLVRKKFSSYCFDEAGCKEGLEHLAGYKKKWNRSTSKWSDEPVKNKHTEAADALRQHAQGWTGSGLVDRDRSERRRQRDWKTS